MPEEPFPCYDSAAYFEAVMEEGGDDPTYVARSLGVVARTDMTGLGNGPCA